MQRRSGGHVTCGYDSEKDIFTRHIYWRLIKSYNIFLSWGVVKHSFIHSFKHILRHSSSQLPFYLSDLYGVAVIQLVVKKYRH